MIEQRLRKLSQNFAQVIISPALFGPRLLGRDLPARDGAAEAERRHDRRPREERGPAGGLGPAAAEGHSAIAAPERQNIQIAKCRSSN